MDHDYNLTALPEACGVIEEIEIDQTSSNETGLSKENKGNWDQTPIKNKNSKRSRSQDDSHARAQLFIYLFYFFLITFDHLIILTGLL